MRFMRTSKHLTSNTPIHWAAWLGCTGGITLVGYLIGSGIPVFDGLISLIGAVFATLMMFQPMGFMWLYDNWHKDRNAMWKAGVAWALFNIIMGTFITIGKLPSISRLAQSPCSHVPRWYLRICSGHYKLEGPNRPMVVCRQLQLRLRAGSPRSDPQRRLQRACSR